MRVQVKVARLACYSGASRGMLVGSLLDASLQLEQLESGLAGLTLGGGHLDVQRVTRQGLAGTHLHVLLDSSERPARHLSTVEHIITESALPERVRARGLCGRSPPRAGRR